MYKTICNNTFLMYINKDDLQTVPRSLSTPMLVSLAHDGMRIVNNYSLKSR